MDVRLLIHIKICGANQASAQGTVVHLVAQLTTNRSLNAVVRRVVSPTLLAVGEIVSLSVPLMRFVVRTGRPARRGISVALMGMTLLAVVLLRMPALRTSPSQTPDSNSS